MSGECPICHEHCLDCKCDMQELPCGLVRTGYSVKIRPMFITTVSPRKFMKKYQVKGCDGCYTIIADTWSVGQEGLKFYQNKEIVAW